jgi:DNA-binding transcriptional MerR regulator
MKYTIDELSKKVNELIKQSSDLASSEVSDKRIRDEISVRRIRDYYSKGLMSYSMKEGRNAYYDDNHVKQLLALKLLQNEGITESYIKKQINIFDSLELDQFLTNKNIIVDDTQIENVKNSTQVAQQAYYNTPSFSANEVGSFMSYTQNVHGASLNELNVTHTTTEGASLNNAAIATNATNHTQNISAISGQAGLISSNQATTQSVADNLNDIEKRQQALSLIDSFKKNQESTLYSSSLSNFKKRGLTSADNTHSLSTSHTTKINMVATEYKEYQVHEDFVLKVKSPRTTLTQAEKDEVVEKIKQILNI